MLSPAIEREKMIGCAPLCPHTKGTQTCGTLWSSSNTGGASMAIITILAHVVPRWVSFSWIGAYVAGNNHTLQT